MEDAELKKRAERIAKDKFGFLIHLVVYIGVNSMLIVLWFFIARAGGTSVWDFVGLSGEHGFPWFLIPILGWGVGLLAHFLVAYLGEGYLASLEKKEYNRLKKMRRV